MAHDDLVEHETLEAPLNPLGMEGIEFVEYATSRPQALGHALETMGFRPVARHRSREVMLYRQGGMNVIVNAHARDGAPLSERPVIAALAFRVRDAASAYRRALDRGAWAVPGQVEVMELNIPAVHGVGASRIYFVDRYREFSIYDVDFVPIPTVDQHPPALTGLHLFGVVQYIGFERTADWTEFYGELFGFTPLPDDLRFGVMPKGRLLRSACGQFLVQLVEPEVTMMEVASHESLTRLGLGCPNVAETVAALRARGVGFVETGNARPCERGALTDVLLGSLTFELVHSERPEAAA